MSETINYLPAIEIESPEGAEVDAAIIWLHGLGADGSDFAPLVPQLELPEKAGIRFVFPHAPNIPVTINNGFTMRAWYNIKELDLERHIDEHELLLSAERVQDLIDREIARGVASERIIVAGFSQGGAVAYQAALAYGRRLGGLISLSSYFATANSINMHSAQAGLPVLVCHGEADGMVPETLGRQSIDTLTSLGLTPDYRTYPMEHAVCPAEVTDIGDFIRRVLD